MKKYIRDIKEKTSGMTAKETCSYVLAYYWYHILIFVSAAALILLFAMHYGFGNKKALFTCVIVNQKTDETRDLRIRDGFAEWANLPRERVAVDSDYNFSYDRFQVEGANESSYEKFFFRWRNQEIDAVILPESFYRHCEEMGGSFREPEGGGGLQTYTDEGENRAVILGTDTFMEEITGKEDEKLLLAFPESGKHTEESRQFLKFVCEKIKAGRWEF